MIRLPGMAGIRGRLGWIFLAFLFLLVAAVTVTFHGLEAQKMDARVINLTGRQRMLLQQMAGLALRYEREPDDWTAAALRDSAASFDQTLGLLRSGGELVDYTGETITLSPPRSPVLQAELGALAGDWRLFQAGLDTLLTTADAGLRAEAAAEIQARSPALVDQADRVVRVYETLATGSIARLRLIQLLTLGAGMALMGFGWWTTRQSVVQPLARLMQAAQRIGQGDLDSPIQPGGPAEVQMLGRTMDVMRRQILTSRTELEQWAATLESRVRQRTRELEALAAVSQEINAHLSINEVFSSVVEKARELSGSEVASLCLLDGQGKVLNLHAAAGPEAAIRSAHSPADGQFTSSILRQSCARACGLQDCEGSCRIIRPVYRASHLAAPLRSHEKVIGALCVGSSQPDAFRPETEAVLTQLAGAAAVALENSRLYQQAEHAATLEERQRIASEMHDGLLQTLSFLALMVRWSREHLEQGDLEKALASLQQVERAEEQAEHEIRRAIASLQDDFPVNYTLQEQLAALAGELSKAGPPVRYRSDVLLPVILPRQEGEQALRVVREAVLNAQRYSQADEVSLRFEEAGGEIRLTVADCGVGFDPEAKPGDGRPHFGIKIMRARAARLGGRLELQSAPGRGTVVRLAWTPSAPVHHPTGGRDEQNTRSTGG